MIHNTFNFSSNDGLELFGRIWQTEEKHPKGIVNLIHGLGEHTGRYDHVAKAITKAGYHMVGFDLRGHGLSKGKRGHSPGFDCILDDVSLFLDQSRSLFGGDQPAFLYGHSLGGLIVITFGLRRPENLAGVIATDPALALAFAPPKAKLTLGKFLANLAPALAMGNGLDVDALSRDAAIVKAYQEDALVHDRISTRLSIDMLAAGDYALAKAEDWSLPLLLMHGTGDRITSSDASKAFAEEAGSGVTFVPWEGYYHEIHNDIGKEKVIEKMVTWLDDQVK